MQKARERGAALVEFAFVLTLLAPLIAVIAAWGIRYHNAAQVDNAAFIAARYYAINCATSPGTAMAGAQGAGAAATPLVSASDIVISGVCTSGNTITAKIDKLKAWIPAVPIYGMTNPYHLHGAGAARCE